MMNKMMKKLAVLLAVGAVSVAGITTMVHADTGKNISVQTEKACGTRTCAVDEANIRTEPSTNGGICGSLKYGDVVRISGFTDNGWVLLENGGYVKADLLTEKTVAPKVDENVNPKNNWIKESNSSNTTRIKKQRGEMSHDNDTFTVNVSSSYLALRSSAVTDPANEIAQLSNGTMVQVKEYGTQFDYVYVPSIDMYGYVNNDYLAG